MDENTRQFDQEDDQPTRRLDPERDAPQAGRTQTCARCGGEMMEVEVSVPGASGRVDVKRPGTWTGLFSGGVSQVGGFVCQSCGAVDLYVLDLKELLRRE